MQKLRDNPVCAESESLTLADDQDPGISFRLKFDPADISLPVALNLKAFLGKPRVAILREQGVNGHAEMAFAFRAAGFDAIDVHMSDILSGLALDGFTGIAACGGFSYGDVVRFHTSFDFRLLSNMSREFSIIHLLLAAITTRLVAVY